MDPSSVFTLQATRLRSDLAGEAKWLEATLSKNGAYAPFASKLRGDIERTLGDLDALIANSRNGAKLGQRRFSSIRDRAANLFGEALALRLVGFIREANVDAGMCAVADRLLAELARAVMLQVQHLSTIAESEFFGTSTRVIRLRYPSVSIWDLPVLGHEFGHWFGPLWYVDGALQPYPQKAFLDSKVLGSRTLAEEFFCDLLAVFLLGPAYVYMCVVLRFDPTNTDDSDTHPADARRAWWVLRALELLAGAATDVDTRGDYQRIAERLRTFWKDYAAKSGARDFTDTEVMNSAAEDLFSKVQLAMPTAAYTDPSGAWGLARRYQEKADLSLQEGQLRDLLNACWFAREDDLANLQKADQIDSWAREIAKKELKK